MKINAATITQNVLKRSQDFQKQPRNEPNPLGELFHHEHQNIALQPQQNAEHKGSDRRSNPSNSQNSAKKAESRPNRFFTQESQQEKRTTSLNSQPQVTEHRSNSTFKPSIINLIKNSAAEIATNKEAYMGSQEKYTDSKGFQERKLTSQHVGTFQQTVANKFGPVADTAINKLYAEEPEMSNLRATPDNLSYLVDRENAVETTNPLAQIATDFGIRGPVAQVYGWGKMQNAENHLNEKNPLLSMASNPYSGNQYLAGLDNDFGHTEGFGPGVEELYARQNGFASLEEVKGKNTPKKEGSINGSVRSGHSNHTENESVSRSQQSEHSSASLNKSVAESSAHKSSARSSLSSDKNAPF